ncbi:putative nuclease HARBI1 [Trichonephila clavipes]|nr:putative nuclease HARBI1 [Trichonephila clavipes]
MLNLNIAFPSTPTRFGHNSANTIDIALIKNFYYPFTINSIDDLSSDHNPVFLNFNFKLAEAPPNPRAVFTDWKTFKINLNKNLSLFDFHPNNINNTNDLEQKITEFTEAVIDTHSHASRPIETDRRNFTPHNINQLIKIKNYFRKRYHETLNPIFKSHYNRAQSDLKKELIKYNDIIWQKRLEALNTADNSLWRTQNFSKIKDQKFHLLTVRQPVEQVLIALRFYAVACMQLAIADLFDVSQPTVCRVVHRVSEAIASLLPDFIHLPVNREEHTKVSRKFFSIAGFPKVIGALDGTFVRIVSPGGEDAERFRCRKNYFALNVQTVVDSDLVIRNVVARWPGSAHDSTVFNNSAACLSLRTNALYQDFHLLGDTGYACEKYLLTPFGNPRSLSEARGPEPPADPQIEALVRQLELENEDATLSFETRPHCPAGFAKINVIVTNFFSI